MVTTNELYELFKQCSGVSTDTRKDVTNMLFFCLSGEHFNGNKFAQAALEKGAKYVVIDNPEFVHLQGAVLVQDTLKALQDLATHHRKTLATPVIAVTGTNGKTTTKELVKSVLSTSFEVTYTEGNLNNHIGVPLTLLKIQPSTQMAIVEMGANHPKEIENLCQIALPDYGYITNFGKAHIEGFGSLEGVIAAKSELYHYLIHKNAVVFFDFDNLIQHEKLHSYPKAYGYSLSGNADAYLSFSLAQEQPFVSIKQENITYASQLVGGYNATNIAAAVTIGRYFRIATHQIQKGIAAYSPTNNRSQLQQGKNGNTLLLDAYNANPSSMLAALTHFKTMPAKRKVLILGDMRELGASSHVEHQAIAHYLTNYPAELIVLVGEAFSKTTCPFVKIRTTEEAVAWVQEAHITNSLILIKASRGVRLEKIQAVLV